MVSINSSESFRRYAGTHQDRWNLLVGAIVEHTVHGIGIVRSVKITRFLFTRISMKIQFNWGEMNLSANDFHRVSGLSFSTSVIMDLRQRGIDISQLPAPKDETADSPANVAEEEHLPSSELSVESHSRNVIKEPPDKGKSVSKQEVLVPISRESDTAISQDLSQVNEDQFSEKDEVEQQLPLFMKGEVIRLRNNPAKKGMVKNEPVFGEGKFFYDIFFSADEQRTIAESDLQAIPKEVHIGFDREFLRSLLVLKLKKPLEDNLYSAYASKTKFEVYQFKPALKFLKSTNQRLLIADEVGLGKTIEAGIIYLELQARLDLARVLIVCPSGLRYKWQDEFHSRFDEEFDVLNKERFHQFIQNFKHFGDATRLRGIVSIELLRIPEQIDALTETNIPFDLVVIDEAHHCRNSETQTNRMAMVLEEQSDAILLLTATPLQTSNRDLFNLFRILNPAEFDDYFSFEDRLVPNQYITEASSLLERGENQAALKTLRLVERTNQRGRFLSNPFYRELVDLLSREDLSKKELIYAQRIILDLNTLSLMFTRTRKRDAMLDPPIRTAEVIKNTFTSEEEEYYKRVVAFIKTRYLISHPGSPVYTWTTMMKERQVTSCVTAFHRKFSGMLETNETESENEIFGFSNNLTQDSDFADNQEYLMSLKELRNYLLNWNPPRDTKFQKFFEVLHKILEESPDTKVLVFSFFIDTVNYLSERLRQQGIKSLSMHGGFSILERQATIDTFRDTPEFRVLVSSDVGAEGLDFQFCDTLFNYDLPWNPMKVEQRIGRIDRFGQQSKRIRIYNMVIANTIEDRILYRLYERIGLFKRAIGDIELILGEEINSLAELIFSKDLTPEEESELVERTARNIELREQEQEEFEHQRLQFMGQEVIFSNLLEQSLDAGGYISENELRAMVSDYINKVDGYSHLDRNPGGDNTYTLMINDELSERVKRFILQECKGDKSSQAFLTRLRPGKEMPLTFSSERAFERKPLEFITARHPLAQCAFKYWKHAPLEGDTIFKVRFDSVEPKLWGEYHFFVYLLDMIGMKSSVTLHPVVVDPSTGRVSNRLSQEFIKRVQNDINNDTTLHTHTDLEQLEVSKLKANSIILQLRNEQELRFRKENDMFLNARKFALEQSYEAKKKRVREIIEKVEDERIIRLRKGQLRNLESKYNLQLKELEGGREVIVAFTLAMKGFLVVGTPRSFLIKEFDKPAYTKLETFS